MRKSKVQILDGCDGWKIMKVPHFLYQWNVAKNVALFVVLFLCHIFYAVGFCWLVAPFIDWEHTLSFYIRNCRHHNLYPIFLANRMEIYPSNMPTV